MSEATDTQVNAAQAGQQSVWDPALGRNVYTNNPAQYIQDHPDHYQNYTGNVQPGVNKEALLGTTPTNAPYETQFKAGGGQAALNPAAADPFSGQKQTITKAALGAKIVPGAAPNVGVLPDGTVVDLMGMKPIENVDPVTAMYAKLANQNPNTPRWKDIGQELDLNGRGYQYAGDPSPEEQALATRFLAGDMKAAGPLAQMRQKRLQVTPKPGIDPYMKMITQALMQAGASFMGPIPAGIMGAGLGMANSGNDWKSALVGLGSGLAGGYTSGAVAPLAGGGALGGAAGGAAGGLVGSGTKVGLTSALGGEVNPWDVAIGTAAGAASGGLVGALNSAGTSVGSDPGGIGNFEIPPSTWERFLNSVAGKAAGTAASRLGSAITPGDPTHFDPQQQAGSPFPSKNTMDAYRQAELDRAREALRAKYEDYQSRLDEYNAKKAEAFGLRDQKMAEYNQKLAEYKAAQQAALDRLHQQALSYLESARGAMTTPLPPIPVPAGSPTPPPPDPFDPSAALSGQTFAGDFPVTGVSMQQSTSNPAPETTAALSKATPKTTVKQLPLNIMQIQAALGRRR